MKLQSPDNMFGNFIRRWKSKRGPNSEKNESSNTDSSVSPEPPDRPPGKVRQIHPEDKTQVLASETSFRRRNKPKTLPIDLEDNSQMYNHLANTNVAMSPYPMTPNICVEGGKIEFIKTPPESARSSLAFGSPPQTPLLASRRLSKHECLYEESVEKFDVDKEVLEKRIKRLEALLEEERRKNQKEKIAVTKLQTKLVKREGAARSDAERERRARGDWEARARAAEADADKLAHKLHAAQKEINRMEETVRSLLQYKSKVECLKQEQATLSAALEASSAHYQNEVSLLTAENDRLRSQLSEFSIGVEGGEHERKLDDVAQQVVRALLTQKSIREELSCARARVRELESQNRALSTLLLRGHRPLPRPSPASPHTPHTPQTPNTPHDLQVLVEVGSLGSLVSFRESPPPPALSLDDKRRHQILADIWTELKNVEVTPSNVTRALWALPAALWAAPPRPRHLPLNTPPTAHHQTNGHEEKIEEECGEAGAESPESGAKDEGYSTMSSDVQNDQSRQSDNQSGLRALPDLNEASDETDNQTIVSYTPRRAPRILTDPDLLHFPLGLTLAGVRGSFPPSRPPLPFQHVMRSFSDSHLCLKFMSGTTCGSSCLDTPTPSSGVLVLDLKPHPDRSIRNARLSSGSEERSEDREYDAEYVQHWLELDDARSALQQRHRDLVELEYDRAEVEDWSLSISSEDLRERHSPFAEITTPGQISLSTLPSIREDDAVELDVDVGDCLWNECGFATVEIDDCRAQEVETPDKRWENRVTSPGGSWSSAAVSEDGDCANVGLNFTRDFYRLVKYESTKSLESNSSRGVPQDTNHDPDREQALQSVLEFIAEQRKYVREREDSDSTPSRPTSDPPSLPPPPLDRDEPRLESFESFSENDSNCDIEPYDRLKYPNCELSETRSTPRFIEKEDPYVESEGYYQNYSRLDNVENEMNDQHLLKVHRKNEINKIDYSQQETHQFKDERPCDIESSRGVELNNALKENSLNIKLNKQINDRVEVDPKPSLPYSNGESEMFVEEVLNVCRKSALLVPVPEEEEASPDGSSPHMTESYTTSTSTAETVIISNSTDRQRNSKADKSKIPTLIKRPPPSPKKNKSRIPVLEKKLQTDTTESVIFRRDTLSFHEAATSKDVIDELNRIIRRSEGPTVMPADRCQEELSDLKYHKDSALWAPTSWVHVQKEVDLSDPKARANILDVMLASSDSSPSSCSSSPAEAPLPYSRLHKIHRTRRQKTAARQRARGLGVVRLPRRRPSILGRDGLFTRWGDRERAALAAFDFLDRLDLNDHTALSLTPPTT